MTELRPHRPARSPEAAAAELRREARAGRLDADAVAACWPRPATGARPPARELVAGLSEREVEVLRLMARGHSIKQIAQQLRSLRRPSTTTSSTSTPRSASPPAPGRPSLRWNRDCSEIED